MTTKPQSMNTELRQIVKKALDSFAETKKYGRAADNDTAMANARQFAQLILDELEDHATSEDHHPGSIDLHRLRRVAPHAKGCQYVCDDPSFVFCPKCGANLTPDVGFTAQVPISVLMTVDVVAGTRGKDHGFNGDGTLEIMYSPEIKEGLISFFIEKRLYASAKLSKPIYDLLLLWVKDPRAVS